MRKKFRKTFFSSSAFLAIALFLFSCSGEKENKFRAFPDYEIWMDSLLLTKEKIIRGIEPGMSTEEVLKIEKVAPSEQDSTALYYEFILDSTSTFSVNYSLINGKVREIELIILSKNIDYTAEIYTSLKNYFSKKYADPVSEKGISIFSGITSGGENLKISLEDESGIREGKIALLVYLE